MVDEFKASYPSTIASEEDEEKAKNAESSKMSASKINDQLNELFRKRLENIQLKEPDDLHVTILVYQKWIDVLLRSTQLAIKQKELIEGIILQKLKPYPNPITLNADEICVQCQKCREDIEKLIKYFQQAFHNNDFDLADLKLNEKVFLKDPE